MPGEPVEAPFPLYDEMARKAKEIETMPRKKSTTAPAKPPAAPPPAAENGAPAHMPCAACGKAFRATDALSLDTEKGTVYTCPACTDRIRRGERLNIRRPDGSQEQIGR